MTTELPDMGAVGTSINTRLTDLETQTETNENNISALESQIIAVCNEIATSAQASNLSEEQ